MPFFVNKGMFYIKLKITTVLKFFVCLADGHTFFWKKTERSDPCKKTLTKNKSSWEIW